MAVAGVKREDKSDAWTHGTDKSAAQQIWFPSLCAFMFLKWARH